jgi:CDP-paratose 2-epimerase
VKILITGHEGCLGSGIKAFLEGAGHEVFGWGRRDDLLSITSDALKDRGVEVVVHCAVAMDRIATRYAIGGSDERVNVFGTRQLVQALQGTGVALVHISTKDVYGDIYGPADVVEEPTRYRPGFEVDDSQPFRPATVYAKTKLMSEFIAGGHLRTNVIRLSSCYTTVPHRNGNWVQRFCINARLREPVRLAGNGKQLRDLLHVDDLGRLVLRMAEADRWGHALNAGGGPENLHSVIEVLDQVDASLPREFVAGGDYGFVANNRTARQVFGWAPTILFRDQLPLLLARMRWKEVP